mgnify:CR=1 FL=1
MLYVKIGLQCSLFELLDVTVNTVHLIGDLDILRAMLHALAATDTMVRLAQLWHRAVVAHKKRPAGTPILGVLHPLREVTLIDTAVVMGEYSGDIDTIRAGHTIVAFVARDGLEIVDVVGNLHQKRIFLRCDRSEEHTSELQSQR